MTLRAGRIQNSSGGAALGLFQAFRWLWAEPQEQYIIWAHHSDSHRWLGLALAIARRDYIVVEQLVPASLEDLKKSRLTVPLKRFVARHARTVVLNGYSQVEHYRQLFRLPTTRIQVIPNSRPVELIAKKIRSLRSDRLSLKASLSLADVPTIVCVGRLCEQKNQATLIRAMGMLHTRAQLVLVGDGPDRGKLEELVLHGGYDNIIFAGFQDEPLRWLAAADLFVLPSQTEGLPGALIEAMAAGLPCISTNVPGNRELVMHESTGLVIEQGSPAALAGAIQRLLQDPSLSSELAEAGFRHVVTTYDEWTEAIAWRRLFAPAA